VNGIKVPFVLCYFILFYVFFKLIQNNVVGIATRYGLVGPGIESLWGESFSEAIQTDPEAYPASYSSGAGFFWAWC
jgi:hypothetical protein